MSWSSFTEIAAQHRHDRKLRIDAIRAEMKRFSDRLDAWEDTEPGTSRASGAARRASLDLSAALVKFRRWD